MEYKPNSPSLLTKFAEFADQIRRVWTRKKPIVITTIGFLNKLLKN